ncbi:hypothetical protein AVEN_36986-1 [Araneus ventricosus]|uniref:Uncharacterized protein n=1 Tax=Araneus ventricosus TaxID=182803 RepID=A0A4Y2W1G4_ARAVE|nr:hypothetical protein AVEN_36986-1 [Araneus ventricosus]
MLLFVLAGESLFSFFLFETSLKSVKSGEANASSLTGATDGEEEIGKLVNGGDALAIESGGLELQIEILGFFWTDGAENDFFCYRNVTISGCRCLRFY